MQEFSFPFPAIPVYNLEEVLLEPTIVNKKNCKRKFHWKN